MSTAKGTHMILLFGTRTFTWGSDRTIDLRRCPNCGHYGQFIRKQSIRTITLFFVLPIIPLGRIEHVAQCPNCGIRYADET